MRRVLFLRLPLSLCAPLLLCLASPALAADGSSTRASNEALAALELQLHSMLGQLTDLEDARPVFRRHRDDHYSLTVRLSEGQKRRLARTSSQARSPRLLAVGQQTSIPSRPGFVSNPVLVSSRSILNFWWALYNPGDTVFVAETRLTVKNADRIFLSQIEDLAYPAGAITLHWEGKSVSLESAGLYTNRVRVSGAGSRKTQFVVD